MTKADEVALVTLKWMRTSALNDHEQYLRDDAELRASGIDPLDVVAHMAAALAHGITADPDWKAKIDAMIEQLEVFVELGIDSPVERESDG